MLLDLALFVSGLALTLTAHADFAKAHAAAESRQKASGPLHAKTTVTGPEMLEHAFYHLVNGFQIVYVHVVRQEWFRSLPVATRAPARWRRRRFGGNVRRFPLIPSRGITSRGCRISRAFCTE